MLHGVGSTHDHSLHQVTDCMYAHKHRMKTETGTKSGGASLEAAAKTAQAQTTPVNLWNLWEQLVRRGFGRRGGFRVGHDIESSMVQSDSYADTDQNSLQEGTIQTGPISQQEEPALTVTVQAVQMSAMAEPKQHMVHRILAWTKEKSKRVVRIASQLYAKYFSENKFGDHQQYQSKERRDHFMKFQQEKSKQEQTVGKETISSVLPSDEFLLDSYNKSGEYTKLMK